MRLFSRKAKQHYLTCLGLFAVLMLTIGPVTSQILAMVSFASHSTTMSQHEAMDHSNHHNPTNTDQTESQTNHHQMNLCGYCDLLHTPVLTTNVTVALQAPVIHQYITPYFFSDIFSPLYNSPLSRAPPSLFI
ncbi:DUF2946 domain-containing protein [Entomomonas asaccharolytica]|uniref:DUF2946 domain-containing protein n=1 Tax=Entomomonas asaccharolytica TaxID=2785331 RepID=A0A974RYR2_9GAMM|nr:DUF2946 domain-containing protein [Entomomonas asaccharolytica]QQP86179.1 DUF2946 domain-containing protein [Entomomonas asaccharolytica]